jgi:hypothetical protein
VLGSIFCLCVKNKNKNMIDNAQCDICDNAISQTHKNIDKQNDDISFAALLALVPVMTLTLFSLMGLI